MIHDYKAKTEDPVLRPLTTYTRTPSATNINQTTPLLLYLLNFFINTRNKRPTIFGWILILLLLLFAVNSYYENKNRRGSEQDSAVKRPRPKEFPVSLIHEPELRCSQPASMLVIVTSMADHAAQRDVIRQTWGINDDVRYGTAVKIRWRTIFVIGRNYKHTESIKTETRSFADILQGDFEDSYLETTRKFMLALTWVSTYQNLCQFRFVLKTEDNVFINMIALTGWLEAKYDYVFTKDRHLYTGKLVPTERPIRDNRHPFFVSEGDYPRAHFPNFIRGPVYLFSYYSFLALKEHMHDVTPIAPDDAFVGLLAEKIAEIIPKHNDHFHMLTKPEAACHYLRIFFLYNVQPSEHVSIFKLVADTEKNHVCVDAKVVD